MNRIVKIIGVSVSEDNQAFQKTEKEALAEVRASKEAVRGNAKWQNLAAFSTAVCVFKFRRLPFELTTSFFIEENGDMYKIIRVELVKNMYYEALAETVFPAKTRTEGDLVDT